MLLTLRITPVKLFLHSLYPTSLRRSLRSWLGTMSYRFRPKNLVSYLLGAVWRRTFTQYKNVLVLAGGHVRRMNL